MIGVLLLKVVGVTAVERQGGVSKSREMVLTGQQQPRDQEGEGRKKGRGKRKGRIGGCRGRYRKTGINRSRVEEYSHGSAK